MSDPGSPTRFVYKILTRAQWADAARTGVTHVPLDEDDGYVHLSAKAQVHGTLTRHFAAETEVVVLCFETDGWTALRWETSRGGVCFPHLYAPLVLADAVETYVLKRDEEGAWPDFKGRPG